MDQVYSVDEVPVHAREAIIKLIDLYGEYLRISRRQLADEAGVNPGQVSNWLRNDGPMGVEKEGRVTDTMLRRIDEYLERNPEDKIVRPLKLLRQPLQSFGPRKRMYAARPEAAYDGHPISRDNPHYITRPCDLDLDDKLSNDVISMEVTGGPKMGKSSLLLAAQQVLESTRTAILVDLAEFTPSRKDVTGTDYERELMQWVRQRAEEQLSGNFAEVLEAAAQFPRWVESNLLPNALNGRCVLLFDNLTSLHPDGVAAVDRAVTQATMQRGRRIQLRRFGVVVAFDRAHGKVTPRPEIASVILNGRLDPVWVTLFEDSHVGQILRTHDPAGVNEAARGTVLRLAGGHPWLTQRLAHDVFNASVEDLRIGPGWVAGVKRLAAGLSDWGPRARTAWGHDASSSDVRVRLDSGLQRIDDAGSPVIASPELVDALVKDLENPCTFLTGKP